MEESNMEERDKVITITFLNRGNNDSTQMEFVLSGKDLATKSSRELRDIFVENARDAFEKMLKPDKINQFLKVGK